jgi:hypothetical protein
VLAAKLVAGLASAGAGSDAVAALRLDGIDLAPALEQQLFFALRDGRRPPAGARAVIAARLAGLAQLGVAATGALLPARPPDPGPAPVVALVRERIHLDTLVLIETELRTLTGQPIAVLRVGRAARGGVRHALAPPLWSLMNRRMLRAALAHRRQLGELRRAGASWVEAVGSADRASDLARIAAAELARIGLGAAALASAVIAWRPSILVAFDEVGTWARILPAVATRHGIPSLDLPHAEAADADAIAGAAYDRMAVYGPRAASVLRRAGIRAGRIVEIGAPRFDALAGRSGGGNGADRAGAADGADEPSEPATRRVVFAGQYPTDALTSEMIMSGLWSAIAAAERVAPAEVVAVPHPAEPRGLLRGLASQVRPPNGVTLRIADGDLHHSLADAWLVVTCWSNSVLEAALLGVPAITVHAPGAAPVDFSADGLASAASGPEEAARIAAELLDPRARRRLTSRASVAVRERLGPELGHASFRAAQLIADLQR